VRGRRRGAAAAAVRAVPRPRRARPAALPPALLLLLLPARPAGLRRGRCRGLLGLPLPVRVPLVMGEACLPSEASCPSGAATDPPEEKRGVPRGMDAPASAPAPTTPTPTAAAASHRC
jgi:hypothetical protein